MKITGSIPVLEVIRMAGDLASEDAENSEYDRALVELCTDVLGLSMDHKDVVAHLVLGRDL